MKQKLLLLAAVGCGFLAFLLSYAQLQREKAKIIGTTETAILVKVTRNLAAGEELTEADIGRIEIPRLRNQPPNLREIPWSQSASVIGRTLETSVSAGSPLLYSDLKPMSQRNGFTHVIRPGMRAVSVPVDVVGSVNNLVGPNDNVDVIGTFRFPDLKGDAAIDTVTLTILQNVKVLAVGSRWGQQYAEPGAASRAYSTVTLLVWPEEVEMLIFAGSKGKLSLSLRNFEDTRIDRALEGRSIDFRKLEKMIPSYNQERMRRTQGR